MRVKLLKPWGTYRAGVCFNPQPNMAAILIKRGMALEMPERIEPKPEPQRQKAKRK